MNLSLCGLFVWRNCVSLGYPVLESFLSAYPMLDEALICVDPTSDIETLRLCSALEQKFSNVRVIHFEWPMGKVGGGKVIGIATDYALAQVRTTHFVNVQADELYSPPLMEWFADNWKQKAMQGYDCFRFKVLNLEHNAQGYQGGGDWNRQLGAGYTHAIKFGKKCPAITFEPDAWSLSGCAMPYNVVESETSPVVHCHDHFRDSLIDLRRTAADALWPDVPHYGASADRIEGSRQEWWDDPKWTATTSPFESLLPWFAKRLLGRTSYSVDWQLLEEWR